MDALTELLIALAFLGCLVLGWVIGRLFDPTWRVKRMRQILRSNTFMLGIISRDRMTIEMKAVNLNSSLFEVGDYKWIIDQSRIYRQDKPQAGFFISKKHIKWEEGVPTVYVYEDSLKPAEFNPEPSKVPPGEIGSSLTAFVAVELAKGFNAIKEYKTFFYVIMIGIVLLILAAIAIYVSTTNAEKNSIECVAISQTIADHFNVQTILTPNTTTNSTNTTKLGSPQYITNGNTMTVSGG